METATHNGIRRLTRDELEKAYSSTYEFVKGIDHSKITGHLQDFIRNQSNAILMASYVEDKFSDRQFALAIICAMKDLKDYTKLLQKHPEYHRQELESEFGAFPEIKPESDDGMRDYVRHSIKELNKI